MVRKSTDSHSSHSYHFASGYQLRGEMLPESRSCSGNMCNFCDIFNISRSAAAAIAAAVVRRGQQGRHFGQSGADAIAAK
jgi:hypothetical protein